MTRNAPMSGIMPHETTMKTWNNQTIFFYQIDTSDQDEPVDRDEDTSEASDVEAKEH